MPSPTPTAPPELPPASWPVQRPHDDPPKPVILPTFPTADQVRSGKSLSRGAVRLWLLLHRLAVDTAQYRAYAALPNAVTFHLPTVAIAAYLRYTERHTYRLLDELKAVGLITGGGHAQNVAGRALWDGSLWKVATTPGHRPQLRAEEWKFPWRPSFEDDYVGKNGAAREMSELLSQQEDVEVLYQALKRRAAVPNGIQPAATSSSDIPPLTSLHEVAMALPDLMCVHATRRSALVSRLASGIAVALNEPHRHRQWCGALWRVVQAENEGRPALQPLAAALHRLAVDLAEGAPWRKPGAVLTKRVAA